MVPAIAPVVGSGVVLPLPLSPGLGSQEALGAGLGPPPGSVPPVAEGPQSGNPTPVGCAIAMPPTITISTVTAAVLKILARSPELIGPPQFQMCSEHRDSAAIRGGALGRPVYAADRPLVPRHPPCWTPPQWRPAYCNGTFISTV